ncbi:putative reverse transcriptase domain-containing protein [Tanacetum coccineum]
MFNATMCDGGTGIFIRWDLNVVRIMLLSQSSQLMNVLVESVNGHHKFFCSFVYGHVKSYGRRSLWKDLVVHNLVIKDSPWSLLGDFNIIMEPSERSMGSSSVTAAMEEFRDCVYEIELWMLQGLVFILLGTKVQSVWNQEVDGYTMFSVTSKLKLLKNPLRKLKYSQGDLAANVKNLKEELCRVQSAMEKDPTNAAIRNKEVFLINKFKDAVKDEELFLKQRIEVVEDMEGNLFSGNEAGGQFVKHFENVLGRRGVVDPIFDPVNLFLNKLSDADVESMVRTVFSKEIKAALFSMDDDKALGPDGFSSKFFKASWSIMGFEFTQAIKDFFMNELMRNYHRKSGPSKVAFKIDINKAYDLVDWGFLSVNGDHHGYFKGNRDLRQGDPLSPYLFTLIMEVLSLMISRKIASNDAFKYHWRCSKVKLTHLCFANDFIIFSNGDVRSVTILKNALEEFSRVSGLTPNFEKSVVFFGNVLVSTRNAILRVMPFPLGSFPIRYLGVPLISSRLYKKYCDPLIDKVKQILFNWKNKVLSFAGRLQLIQSVLSVRNLWDIPIPYDACWSWRKILYCREVLRSHIVTRIGLMKCDCAPDDLYKFIDFLSSKPMNKSIWSIIQRLVLGSVYILWQEKNLRIFQGKSKTVEIICSTIKELVRLGLLSLKVRGYSQALKAAKMRSKQSRVINDLRSSNNLHNWYQSQGAHDLGSDELTEVTGIGLYTTKLTTAQTIQRKVEWLLCAARLEEILYCLDSNARLCLFWFDYFSRLLHQVCNTEFSPLVIITKSLQNLKIQEMVNILVSGEA